MHQKNPYFSQKKWTIPMTQHSRCTSGASPCTAAVCGKVLNPCLLNSVVPCFRQYHGSLNESRHFHGEALEVNMCLATRSFPTGMMASNAPGRSSSLSGFPTGRTCGEKPQPTPSDDAEEELHNWMVAGVAVSATFVTMAFPSLSLPSYIKRGQVHHNSAPPQKRSQCFTDL